MAAFEAYLITEARIVVKKRLERTKTLERIIFNANV